MFNFKKILFLGLFFSLSSSHTSVDAKPRSSANTELHAKPQADETETNDSYAFARLLTMLTGISEQHLHPLTFFPNTLPHFGLRAFHHFDAQRKISDLVMNSSHAPETINFRRFLANTRFDLIGQSMLNGLTPLAQAAPANCSGSLFEEIAHLLILLKIPLDSLAVNECSTAGVTTPASNIYRKILGKKNSKSVTAGVLSAATKLTENEIKNLNTCVIFFLQHLPQLWNRFFLARKLKSQGMLISSYTVPENMQGKKYFMFQSPLAYMLRNIYAFECMGMQALRIMQNLDKSHASLDDGARTYEGFVRENPNFASYTRHALALCSVLPHLYILESDYENLQHEDKIGVYHAMSTDIFQWNRTATSLAWPHIVSFIEEQMKQP